MKSFFLFFSFFSHGFNLIGPAVSIATRRKEEASQSSPVNQLTNQLTNSPSLSLSLIYPPKTVNSQLVLTSLYKKDGPINQGCK